MSRPQSAARYAWLDLLGSAQTYTGLATFSGGASVTNLTVGGTNTINTSWTTLGATQGGFQRGGDTGYTAFTGGSALAAANGAYLSLYGNTHATYPGRLYLVPGTAGEVLMYNSATAKVLETTTGGILVTGSLTANSTTGTSNLVSDAGNGFTPYIFIKENGNNRGTMMYDPVNHWMVVRKYVDATPASVACQLLFYDSGQVRVHDVINSKDFYVGGSARYYDMQGEEQMTFAGRVAAAGTSVRLPTGWSSVKNSTGDYTVTHNLGTGNYTITCEMLGNTGEWYVYSLAANSFGIRTYNLNTTTLTDKQWMFIMRMD